MPLFLNLTADLHMHTRYSDGAATISEMAEAAAARGMRRIAITDHMPLPFPNRYAMKPGDLERYREEVRRVAEQVAGEIDLKLGLEMEWIPGHEAWTERIARAGWDHSIGSIHQMVVDGGTGIVNGTRAEFDRLLNDAFSGDIRRLCTHYYRHLQALIASGLFRAVGHLDVLKKFNPHQALFREDAPWYRDLVTETLDRIRDAGMTVEINTGGMGHPVAATYPSPWIIQACIHRGVPLAMASDAHAPERIGQHFQLIGERIHAPSPAGS